MLEGRFVRSRREKYNPCFAATCLSELVIVSLARPSTQMTEGARLRGQMQIQPRRRRVDIPAVAFRLAQQLRITYLSTSCDHTAGSIVEKFPAIPGVDRFCVDVNCPARPLLWFRLEWLHPLRAAIFVHLKCRVNTLF